MHNDLDVVTDDESLFVGFTVYQSQPRNYSEGERVEFDSVVTNYGAHYSTSNHTFHCPVPGFYIFFVTVMNTNDHGAELDIILNDDTRLAVAYARDLGIFHQAANAAVTYCGAGDEVWCKSRQEGDELHGFPDFSYTSFSGALLQRVPPN